MFENLRKRIVFWLGVAAFIGAVWAIREFHIFEFFEGLFSDPGQIIPTY
jgi:hypothetical protein